jgi:hypothetical protein
VLTGKQTLCGWPAIWVRISPPVVLQLLPWRRFEPDGCPTPPQDPLGADVVPDQGDLASVASGLDLAQDHHRVPDPLLEQSVDLGFQRIQLACARPSARVRWGSASIERPAHRLGMDAEGVRDIRLVDATFNLCLNHDPVLLSEHRFPPWF